MTILTLNRSQLEKKVGKITKELEEKITEMGTPIEKVTDKELSIEVFPNRPDLLSLQNFSRAVNQFTGKKGIAKFSVNKPEKDYKVVIEKSVKGVRPHTACAIIKGIKLDREKINGIIDLQEKLHNSVGRERKKLAIGIYPLNKINLPIKFVSRKPEEIKFVPLESTKEMTGKQILKSHPTGIEYAKLLKDNTVYPVFIDAEDKILSMPPIINSEETGRIDEKTKDIFIECSGHNLHYLKKCLNIIIASISEMGGKIYAMDIRDSTSGSFTSPDMSPEETDFEIEDIEKILGIKLSEKEIKKCLGRMGIECQFQKRKSVALVPSYRMDILHWVDLAEEIAIAHGYENFEPEIPEISTIAKENSLEKTKKIVAEILTGLGLIEISSFHLTTKKNIKKMHFNFGDFIEVEDSKTKRDVLRMDLLTNLLQIISENSNTSYPQKIFEIGKVFSKDDSKAKVRDSETGVKEEERLAITLIDEKTNFTDLKQILDYLFKMLDIKYGLEDIEDNNYISGRVGKIIVGGKEIGRVGEIAPRIIRNWKIKMPIVSLEINLNFLID